MIEHALRALRVVSSPSPLICATRCCSPNRLQQDLNGCLLRLWRTDSTPRERQPIVGEQDGNCLRKVSKHRHREQYGPSIMRPIDLFHKSQNAPERSVWGSLVIFQVWYLFYLYNCHAIWIISIIYARPRGWVFYINYHVTTKLNILFDNRGIKKSFEFNNYITTWNQWFWDFAGADGLMKCCCSLSVEADTVIIGDGVQRPVFAVNGSVPGPTIVVHEGQEVRVSEQTLIARFMGPTWDPPGSCRPQIGPMLAPWSLLSGDALLANFIIFHFTEVKNPCWSLLWH